MSLHLNLTLCALFLAAVFGGASGFFAGKAWWLYRKFEPQGFIDDALHEAKRHLWAFIACVALAVLFFPQ